MIHIFKDYYLFSDAHNWILREQFEGKDKDGNPKESFRDLGYFRSVEQACKKLINIEAKAADSVQGIIESFESSVFKIKEATEGMKR
jgi:hypothetical protein